MSDAPVCLRVCLVAENASVTMGGEAILPFHYFRVLRERRLEAWLCVHERCAAELFEIFAHDRDRILIVRDQALQKVFHRLSGWLPRRVAEASFGLANQMLTQLAQREVIHPVARVPGTVVHQPIPVAPRFPSLMFGLGCPVVIGPLNGGMEYPRAFRGEESWLSRAAIACGRALTEVVSAALPGKRRAAAVLVANQRTRAALPGALGGRIITMAENGVDLARWCASTTAGSQPKTRFVFVGRLVEWKRLDLAIEALTYVPGAALDVIGDGDMRSVWTRLAEERGVASRVTFHGWLSQAGAARILCDSCALLLPSVYESGGAVVLEAMASGRPVIATAWGGPLDYLDHTCGVLVEPSSVGGIIQGFAQAMQRLLADTVEADRMGAAGRVRVCQHFDWEKKVDVMLKVYRQALGTGGIS